MAGFDSTNNKVVWTTTSVHGNTISLYEDDFAHLLEHPEMAGQEELIKRTVEKPIQTREALYPDACAFEGRWSTNPHGIRVFVQHDREAFLQGGTTGHVTTAYGIDPRIRSRIGPVIKTYPENDGI